MEHKQLNYLLKFKQTCNHIKPSKNRDPQWNRQQESDENSLKKVSFLFNHKPQPFFFHCCQL